MIVRRLSIRNFRGIKSCEWSIDQRLVALVGAGDSAKTTLLDAMGLVLSPNYNPQFTDADFYAFDTSEPITIEAVVTDLPDGLVKESQLGKDRSGLQPDGTLVHDPLDGAEECLVVRLTVTADLEPTGGGAPRFGRGTTDLCITAAATRLLPPRGASRLPPSMGTWICPVRAHRWW